MAASIQLRALVAGVGLPVAFGGEIQPHAPLSPGSLLAVQAIKLAGTGVPEQLGVIPGVAAGQLIQRGGVGGAERHEEGRGDGGIDLDGPPGAFLLALDAQ